MELPGICFANFHNLFSSQDFDIWVELNSCYLFTDTIFVRVYESRMDLLRAVIKGAEGTPYHDGIFFFDICFPSDYPNVPPVCHTSSINFPILYYTIIIILVNNKGLFSERALSFWWPEN